MKTSKQQRIRAWFISRATRNHEKLFFRERQELLSQVQGRVLEIGPGTGANLSFFPPTVPSIGLERNPAMCSYLIAQARRQNARLTILLGTAEEIPLKQECMDVVVSTLVLCSVERLSAVLLEIKRVLKPTGRFIFVEHVAAHEGTWLRWFQHILSPIWQALNNGCDPERDLISEIKKYGFVNINYHSFLLPFWTLIARYNISGEAMKRE